MRLLIGGRKFLVKVSCIVGSFQFGAVEVIEDMLVKSEICAVLKLWSLSSRNSFSFVLLFGHLIRLLRF